MRPVVLRRVFFLGGVPGYTVGTLVRISTGHSLTFQSNDEADAF